MEKVFRNGYRLIAYSQEAMNNYEEPHTIEEISDIGLYVCVAHGKGGDVYLPIEHFDKDLKLCQMYGKSFDELNGNNASFRAGL